MPIKITVLNIQIYLYFTSEKNSRNFLSADYFAVGSYSILLLMEIETGNSNLKIMVIPAIWNHLEMYLKFAAWLLCLRLRKNSFSQII